MYSFSKKERNNDKYNDKVHKNENKDNLNPLFLMQKEMGNELFQNYISQENEKDDLVDKGKYNANPDYSLMDPIRDKGIKKDDVVESFMPNQYVNKDKYPKKFLALSLDTGDVELGYNKDNNKIVMTSRKKNTIYETANSISEKKVDANRAGFKYYDGNKLLSDEIDEGALAVEFNQNTNIQKISKSLNKIKKDEFQEVGALEKVLPFISLEAEKHKENELKDKKNDLRYTEEELKKEKDNYSEQEFGHINNKINELKRDIEVGITNNNQRRVKKDQKNRSFQKKVKKSINNIKETNLNVMLDDLPFIIKKKMLEELEDDLETEENNKN